jgi:hypothetical protein
MSAIGALIVYWFIASIVSSAKNNQVEQRRASRELKESNDRIETLLRQNRN